MAWPPTRRVASWVPRPPRDLLAHWNQLLYDEGLYAPQPKWSPLKGSHGLLLAGDRIDELATPTGWHTSSPMVEQERAAEELTRLTYWLPATSQEAIALHLRGLTQVQMAEQLGTSQPSVCYRIWKAKTRLRRLAEVQATNGLPRDRSHLREMVLDNGWDEDRADFVAAMSVEWSAAAATRATTGRSSGWGRYWACMACSLPGPVGSLVRVITELVRGGGAIEL